MATKAEQFRYQTERSKPKRATLPRRKHDRRNGTDDGARNLSLHAGRKAAVVAEESHSGHPSRKSGRPASNHGKNSTVLEYAARMKSQTPQARHGRRS